MTHPSGANHRQPAWRLAMVGLLAAGTALLLGATALTLQDGVTDSVDRPTATTMPAAPTGPPPSRPDATEREPAATHARGTVHQRSAAGPAATGGTSVPAPGLERAPRPVAIEISRIGVRSELVDLDLDEGRRLEVPADPAVAGWYVRAPRPGEAGPAIVAGHVDSRRGPGVFWTLREIEPGDEVAVHRADGSTVTFVVDRVEQSPKDEFPTEAVYRRAEGPELRLITCGGEFDRSTGSYRDNVIAFASIDA